MTDLKTEHDDDPLVRGYSSMADQEFVDSMNALDFSRDRTEMTGDEVFASLESQAVWDALTADQRLEFLALCGRDSLNPFGSANVHVVVSIFGAPSTGNTTENLQNARVENISRAQELPGVRSPVTLKMLKLESVR